MHHAPKQSFDTDYLDLGITHCTCMAGSGDAVASHRSVLIPANPSWHPTTDASVGVHHRSRTRIGRLNSSLFRLRSELLTDGARFSRLSVSGKLSAKLEECTQSSWKRNGVNEDFPKKPSELRPSSWSLSWKLP